MIGILGGMGTQAGLDFCNKLAVLNRGKIDQEYPLFLLYNKSNIPIDVIISPEIEIAKSIQRKLESPGALDNVPFADNKIKLLEIFIDESCPISEIKLNDLTKKFPKLNANILGVIRDEKFIFLKKNDVIKKNLKIMDSTAFTLSQENNLPIIVFNMNKSGNLLNIINGEKIDTSIKN